MVLGFIGRMKAHGARMFIYVSSGEFNSEISIVARG